MASDEMPDVDVPEGFDVGTIDDATADTERTYRKKVIDEDQEKVYWFDLKNEVHMRKKDSVLEDNLTTEKPPGGGEPQQNLSTDYYYDMLEYMVVDWFGAYEDDAPSLRVFFNKMSTVFEDLRNEVPPPFDELTEAERGK